MFERQSKSVAIIQSSYIPWKGYFEIIDCVDDFVFFDCVQYTRRDWRNRNKIKNQSGTQWLSIPVQTKGNFFQPISDIEVVDGAWAAKHWMTLQHVYGKLPGFEKYGDLFKNLYQRAEELSKLSEINILFVNEIASLLDINTRFHRSDEFKLKADKSEKLLGVVRELGGNSYISGPSAKSYLDTKLFEESGVSVEFFDYSGYGEYSQFNPPFEHGVSILDVLFHTGEMAKDLFRRNKK